MSNKKLTEMLKSHDKQIGQARNPLARIFRGLLNDLGISVSIFQKMLNDYVNRERPNESAYKKSNLKASIVSAFTEPKMSITTFERFVRMLCPLKVTYTVSITMRNGEEYSHSVEVDIAKNRHEESAKDFKQLESQMQEPQ